MKTKFLSFFTAAVAGLLALPASQAQLPDNTTTGEIIGGYVNYTSDHQREFLNQMMTLQTQDPEWEIMPSPFKENYDEWGEIVAGAWVKNEYYAITNLVKVGNYYVGNYIAYEPLTQNYRFIDSSAGFLPSNSADMAYDYVSGKLFAITKSNQLLQLSLTDSSSVLIGTITLDGIEMQDDPFRAIACNREGILYGINDNGMIYSIDPDDARASYVCTLDVPMGVYQQSATFSHSTNRLYWANAGSATMLYEIDIQTGKTTPITETPGLVGLFVHEYQDGAPYHPVSNIQVVKNPSDYTEATLVYTLPLHDMMGLPITAQANMEIWKGKNPDEMKYMATVKDLVPGQTYTYNLKENSGTYYYALRIQNKKSRQFSAFAGTYCSFFQIGFPYHTSFEEEEENGSFFPLGSGWKAYSNTHEYELVKEGERAYGVIEDTLSRFCITGLNVYKGVEYQLTIPAVGYNSFWDYVMSTQWYEAPEKPLRITLPDTTFQLVLNGENQHKTYHDYSFRFTAQRSGLLNIFFQASGEDDAYFIDDITIEQTSPLYFPAPVSHLQMLNNPETGRWAEISFTTPSTTADGQELERFNGVYVQYSHHQNFMDESGNPDYFCDTLDASKGSEVQHRIEFPENGYYYIRVYAFNTAGLSEASPILEAGYQGNLVNYQLTVQDSDGISLSVDSAFLTPLFPETAGNIPGTLEGNQIGFQQLEAGYYQLSVFAYGYAPYGKNLEIYQDLLDEITLEEIEMHPQPQSVQQLRLLSIDHEKRQVEVSWTNPALDQDGNPLQSLKGVILKAFTPDSPIIVKDTVQAPAVGGIGQTTQALLELQAQGHYLLQAYAFNDEGVSPAQEIEIGYVGNGFKVNFHCTDTEGNPVEAVITLVSEQNDTILTLRKDTTGEQWANLPGGLYQVFGSANYYDRLIIQQLNLASDTTFQLDQFRYTFQKPLIQHFETGEREATLTWKNTGSRNWDDSFESYPDFTISNFGEYQMYGHKYKGYFGGVSYPNMQQAYAFMVFNPSATTPAIEDQAFWDTHSGKKMLITTFSLKNDDWITHPVEGGGTLSFWAAGAQLEGSVPEKFQVLYSTTDGNPGSFINAGTRDYILTERDWTFYSFDLPENARYLAIHCMTEDGSLFKIDDLKYTLNHGSLIEKPSGYEVYLNGSKIKDLGAQDTTYHFEDLPNGKHTLGIKAVYTNGSSAMEEREIEVGRVITAPINLHMKNTDTGWLFTWSMPSHESAQYFKVFLDGEFVINLLERAFLFNNIGPSDTEVHTAGVCAVDNEYFSDTIYIQFNNPSALESDLELTTPVVYPNPSRGIFQVELAQGGQWEIYSMTGTRIYQTYLPAGTHSLDISQQQKGIYLYRFSTPQASFTGKIVLH